MANYIEDMIYTNPRPRKIKNSPYVTSNPIEVAAVALREDKFGYVVVRAIKSSDEGYIVKEAIRYPKYPHFPLSMYILNHKHDVDDIHIYERPSNKECEYRDPRSNYLESEIADAITILDVTRDRIQVAENFSYILEQLD